MKIFLLLLISGTFFGVFSNYDSKKGIAMAYGPTSDVEAVGASWYYNYDVCGDDPKCVPMIWCNDDPNLALDYSGYILLFNEPENEAQCNISPENGFWYYNFFRNKYPNAKWVVGNSIFWGRPDDWMHQFKQLCLDNGISLPDIWGIHIYVGTYRQTDMAWINGRVEQLHNDLGGTFWVTEFASVSGDIRMDETLVKYFDSVPYIERYAYFTNRAKGDEAWYPHGWKVQLMDYQTGSLTAIGRWYKDGSRWLYLSLVSK